MYTRLKLTKIPIFRPEEKNATAKLNTPLTQLLAVNKFKALKQRRMTRMAAEAAANNSVETDAETKKANRNSIQSIPEDGDSGQEN